MITRINLNDLYHDFEEIVDNRSDISERHVFAAYTIASALSQHTVYEEEFPTALHFIEKQGYLAVANRADYDSYMQDIIDQNTRITNELMDYDAN